MSQIGSFRFITSNRGLAACLAVLGVPLKKEVPVTNEYGENTPVPQVPFGHPRWKAGRIKWHFEAASESWFIKDRGIQAELKPSVITKAYHNGEAAAGIGDRFKAIDDAFATNDAAKALEAWQALKNDMPLILAGFIKSAEDWRNSLFMPLLAKAYEEEKRTGKSINMITLTEGEGEIHTGINPTEEIKDALL